MAGPEVGDPAPDALLTDLERHEVRLSSLWRDRPAVVVFLRYFGCPFCQTQVVICARSTSGSGTPGRPSG